MSRTAPGKEELLKQVRHIVSGFRSTRAFHPSHRERQMASSKRIHSNIERELARALTDACETAKAEVVGFEWLTHQVDYARFPQSLCVTWVFDNDTNMAAASQGPLKARLVELTLAAFADIGISVSSGAAHVRLDSQQRCDAVHGGDWETRLSSQQLAAGGHGKRH